MENKHYIIINEKNYIIDGWSDGPHPKKDTKNSICINQHGSYQFKLFLDGPENPILISDDGIPIYKYENDKISLLSKIETQIEKEKLNNKNLTLIKSQLIADSKKELSLFLQNNPLTWIDKKQYSVTQEKQALLMEQLALYTIDSNIKLYWNSTGEQNQEWSIEELKNLAKSIIAYVRPYINYQQEKEIEIKSAETVDEVLNIVIDYSTLS